MSQLQRIHHLMNKRYRKGLWLFDILQIFQKAALFSFVLFMINIVYFLFKNENSGMNTDDINFFVNSTIYIIVVLLVCMYLGNAKMIVAFIKRFNRHNRFEKLDSLIYAEISLLCSDEIINHYYNEIRSTKKILKAVHKRLQYMYQSYHYYKQKELRKENDNAKTYLQNMMLLLQ